MLGWWGPVIVEYYAATEGGGTLITSEEWLRKPGSVGRPWWGSQVRILDRSRAPVPPGEQGLVYKTMGTSTFSYHKDQEKTDAARADGMFTVGDIGCLDEDPYLSVSDRTTARISSVGANLYPAETASALS